MRWGKCLRRINNKIVLGHGGPFLLLSVKRYGEVVLSKKLHDLFLCTVNNKN